MARLRLLLIIAVFISAFVGVSFALAAFVEPQQAPPAGNTGGVIWNNGDSEQTANFNIIGQGTATYFEAGVPAGQRGNIRIGDGFSGGVHRPGIWFDKSNDGYDTNPNFYRYQSGSGGDLNAIILRNDVSNANIIIDTTGTGLIEARDKIQAEGGLCLGTTHNANCITAWSEIQPSGSFVSRQSGNYALETGNVLLKDALVVGDNTNANDLTQGDIKLGSVLAGSYNAKHSGIWLKPSGGSYDSYPNIYRYQHNPDSRPGVADAIVIRNDAQDADIIFGANNGGLVSFASNIRGPARVQGVELRLAGNQQNTSTVALGTSDSTVAIAGLFVGEIKQGGTTLANSVVYLGSAAATNAMAAGVFMDAPSYNAAALATPTAAASFIGPVNFKGDVNLNYTNNGWFNADTQINNSKSFDLALGKQLGSAGTKAAEFRIYDYSISDANQLLRLDGEGNLYIKGNLNENRSGSDAPNTATFGYISLEGMGVNNDYDTNVPLGSKGAPKLYLGMTNSTAADETLYLRNFNRGDSYKKANLFIEGDLTVEGRLTGSGASEVHTPALQVTAGANSTTTINGTTAINGTTTVNGTTAINGTTTMTGATNIIGLFSAKTSNYNAMGQGAALDISANGNLKLDAANKVIITANSLVASNNIIANRDLIAKDDLKVHDKIFMYCDDAEAGTGCTRVVSDIAESIDILGNVSPGDIVIVQGTAQYVRSTKAFDKRVMGVFSEDPAFVLAYEPKRKPLAVSGLVKVNAVAENGPIEVGDLLVSSRTPGHAMRCEGAEQCFGAVVGKALESLEKGKGKILMIVTLQ